MGVSVPNLSMRNFYQFSGQTNKVGAKGLPTDTQQFVVSKAGEFNFRINNPHTTVQIVDQRNQVVATAKSGMDVGDASAKLGPGTYRAVVSRQYASNLNAVVEKEDGTKVSASEYKLDVSVRENVLMTAGGGMLRGTAREAVGNDSGVQKHTLNVAQGGEFTANLSIPFTRWVIMDKDGKVKASGDTMKPEEQIQDILKKPSFKLEPGQYELMVVPPKKVEGEVPYNLQFVAKTASLEAPTQEREFDRIMREREERLARWASEDARKPANKTNLTA
ncbi:hypothetical protein [Azospirillum sp. SYSU D00513]|uniref:hypothetical protein n=1 Tax=Azospirillum sp. SYSU D00513 TaxID=2812561 RepID=UPI001A971EFB|nr:hypothetical protein [Azospirillum sp. SYSU D00513]